MRIAEGFSVAVVLLLPMLVFAASAQVTKDDFGTQWPLTVSSGTLSCESQAVTFATAGKTYAVNGRARAFIKQRGWREIDEIWRNNPDIPGTKINIGPLIDRGLKLCGK